MELSDNSNNVGVSVYQKGPTGNPEFAVRFDVKDFKPEEINVSTCGGKLTISGKWFSIVFSHSCLFRITTIHSIFPIPIHSICLYVPEISSKYKQNE